MKKYFTVMIIFVILISLLGCSQITTDNQVDEGIDNQIEEDGDIEDTYYEGYLTSLTIVVK